MNSTKQDQQLYTLSSRYGTTPIQYSLQLQDSMMEIEIVIKILCFDFKQQLLSILCDYKRSFQKQAR